MQLQQNSSYFGLLSGSIKEIENTEEKVFELLLDRVIKMMSCAQSCNCKASFPDITQLQFS